MLFRLQIFKQLTGSDREWSNTYLYEADDLATAVAGAEAIAGVEVGFHLDNVTITRALASDTDPSTDFFATTTLNLIGTAGTGADGDWLPLFNTFRVDFNVTGGGRPSRKYYRGPVRESDNDAGFVDLTRKTAIQASANALLAAANAAGGLLVDPDGQTLINAVAFDKVAMRQLHRKRKKTTP